MPHATPLRAPQGEYDEAHSLYRRAIEIGEKTLGPDHLDLAPRLNNLALLLKKQVRTMIVLHFSWCRVDAWMLDAVEADVWSRKNVQFCFLELLCVERADARKCFAWCESIAQQPSGCWSFHPIAFVPPVLCFLLPFQGENEEADLLYVRAIAIGEKTLSPDNSDLATWRNNRALLLESQMNR